ncbi:MAG: HD domain-containing protein [Treponema sp.]|nr:HD domain-containing protein [Treponema sp.]
MQLLKNEKIINIIEKTLNHMDPRLVDHGKRVAYLMFKILEKQHKHNEQQLRDICILAMLHDIGAYKTEEIDKMVIFETTNVWEHSAYGYLFLKYFSPLKELAEVILYHHADCNEASCLKSDHQLLAQLMSMCDRADIFLKYKKNANDFCEYLQKYRGIRYFGYIVDMFLASGIDVSIVNNEMDSDAVFNKVLYNIPLTEDEVNGYIRMIIFSIDFRSSQTVLHTVTTACAAVFLARLLGAGENEIKNIETGAMLHDIGKIGIPLHILESRDKLSESDMEIMKTHVVISEKILDGNVDEIIKHLAVRHHEKLNGTGYPKKLNAGDISLYDRIIAVADIFSALCGVRSYKGEFPKEKIIGILNDMSGLLDTHIVSLTIKHYDEIHNAAEQESIPVINNYNAINNEFRSLTGDSIIDRR